MSPSVMRPRLRPIWSVLATIGALIALASSLVAAGAVLAAPDLGPAIQRMPPSPEPETAPLCSRTLYYYDMYPFVRERLWCGSADRKCRR